MPVTPCEKEDARKGARDTYRRGEETTEGIPLYEVPECGMELSEPTMLRKQSVVALLVPTLVFEETVNLYQESFKTGVDVQVGCR